MSGNEFRHFSEHEVLRWPVTDLFEPPGKFKQLAVGQVFLTFIQRQFVDQTRSRKFQHRTDAFAFAYAQKISPNAYRNLNGILEFSQEPDDRVLI